MRGAGHVECMAGMRNAYKILARKLEGKRLCGRLKHKWEYNIRLDLQETVEWIHHAKDRDQ
jgi:hypothetical protein